MVIFSQCAECKNYIGKTTDGLCYCKAFKEEIPPEVLWNEIIHDKPINGDNGILCDPIFKKPPIKIKD